MAFDRAIAAMTIYCEASGEAPEVKLAIAHVLRNRLRAGRFGGTVAEVCLRRGQFSEWNGDPINNRNLLRAARVSESDPVMVECLSLWDESGSGVDPTEGATHFHETASPKPSWAQGAECVGQIGAFLFYRGVK